MVRRSLILCLSVCLIMAAAIQAHAAEVYTDGSIPSNYVEIFRDISKKILPTDDYVFYRSGANEYRLVKGDLNYEAGSFWGTNCKSVIISSDYVYGETYLSASEDIEVFDLMTNGYIVYSNLGDFPDLVERSDYYEIATIILLVVGLCLYLLRSIFGFCLRGRYNS